METTPLSPEYIKTRSARLQTLVRRGYLRPYHAKEFALLEDRMNSGKTEEDWLRSFHLSNDDYMGLLQKVLEAAVTAGEPHAKEKLQAYIEEKGIMGPGMFLTPWDITLAFLDREYGRIEEVAAFYGFPAAAAAAP